ncbi:hypothetical protein E2C01_076546 [Portunus trituberculatus]|uniref:Uncharacterized protein n=1 Tax=Portunus trituberculatus TaxID=210409 RepID=A0A5B7IK11_PORTR|nr:hypothetical protein [Portunus trituberculatus]
MNHCPRRARPSSLSSSTPCGWTSRNTLPWTSTCTAGPR